MMDVALQCYVRLPSFVWSHKDNNMAGEIHREEAMLRGETPGRVRGVTHHFAHVGANANLFADADTESC